MFPSKLLLLLLLPVILPSCDGYKILGLFPHPGKSHFDVFKPLLKELALRGHQMTVVSYFPLEQPLKNYTDLSLRDDRGVLVDVLSIDDIPPGKLHSYYEPITIHNIGKHSCEAGLQHKKVQELLGGGKKFDLAIIEMFNGHCFAGIIRKLGIPCFIGVTSHALMPWSHSWFGTPANPSYIPVLFLDHSDQMNFLERVENAVIYVLHKLYYDFVVATDSDGVARKYLGVGVPGDFMNGASLVITNVHYSLTRPRPLAPNVVDVGGIHIGRQGKLPENIERWISESSHGVIYFSLGSMIKGHTFPEDKRRVFQRAFARLKQRVLWKWENDTMPEKPDNVMIRKWMPQLDILCHPNVKAFISHGGLLGTTEAVHCGVPVIAMPQYGDQFTNAKALEASGGGVILDFRTATEEQLYQTLKTVLDPKFNKQAKELSARFRDRPMPPLETAIYWVEYVARHKGAPFMRSAAVGMPLYKYLLLDVIAFLLAVFTAFAYVVYALVRALIRVTVGKGDKKQKKQ